MEGDQLTLPLDDDCPVVVHPPRIPMVRSAEGETYRCELSQEPWSERYARWQAGGEAWERDRVDSGIGLPQGRPLVVMGW